MICVDWPPKELWPNRKAHHLVRARYAKGARLTAFAIATGAHLGLSAHAHLRLTFHPPSNRRFDLDNALAASKAYIDGMADAARCDDSGWSYTVRKGDPVRHGRVVVELVETLP